MPLDVVRQAKTAVSLGPFHSKEEFMVIRSLTVDCRLGTWYRYSFPIEGVLLRQSITAPCSRRKSAPLFMGQRQATANSVVVTAPVSMEIPDEWSADTRGAGWRLYKFLWGTNRTDECVTSYKFVCCTYAESSSVRKRGHFTGDDCQSHANNHPQRYEARKGNPQTQCAAGGW